MKILYFITLADLGGAQSVVINIVKELQKENHDIIVVSSENGEMWDLLPKEITKIKLKNLKRNVNWRDILVYFELLKINLKFKPDIIHLHSSKAGALGRLAFAPQKTIYTVHGFDSIRLGFRKFLRLEKILQKRCASIVAVSNYDKRNLIKEGITHNLETIYNGSPDFSKDKKIQYEENSKIHQLKKIKQKQKKIVLTISRLAKPKRFDLFCDVAQNLAHQKDLVFVWVGNHEIPKIELPVNVILLGEVKNAYTLLLYADLFILFSDYEGMPMSVIEALNFSVPVIASNVGGISEIINENNGVKVDNSNSKVISKKIQTLLYSSDKLKIAQIQARESYDKSFTIHTMYQKYLNLYKSISNKQ